MPLSRRLTNLSGAIATANDRTIHEDGQEIGRFYRTLARYWSVTVLDSGARPRPN
jgi:hypothetical protein